MPRKRPRLSRTQEHVAVYAHPNKPGLRVTTRSETPPPQTRMFKVAGHTVLLHLDDKESTTMAQTKKRPKGAKPKKTREPEPVEELDEDDLEGLDDLDVDDLDDLDLEDEVDEEIEDDDVEEEDEEEIDEDDEDEEDDLDEDELDEDDDEDDDLDLDDEDEDEIDEDEEELEDEDEDEELDTEEEIEDDEEDLDDDEEIEDDEDDDLDDLDDLDDEEEDVPTPKRKAAKAKTKPAAPKKAADGERPLTDAQAKMLATAVKRPKNGVALENIGQKRSAESLIKRGLLKYKPKTDKGAVLATKKGEKVNANGGQAEAKATAKSKAPAKRTKSKAPVKEKKGPATNAKLPKGKYGLAQVAKSAKTTEETVRRVVKLNDDRFKKDAKLGRYAFSKAEAQEVIREVKTYLKYTGGKRGRPAGASTSLPEGKVGPAYIAEQAECHKNTVYNFLRKHDAKLGKYKTAKGSYVFPEKVADKIVAKLS